MTLNRSVQLVALAVIAVAVPGMAYADSDGFYCVGPGYVAYQFGQAPPSNASHRLHVISLRGPQGIPEPLVLELPQFQVHGMVCGDGWVDIAAFTAIYRVSFDENQRPVRYEMQASFAGEPIPPTFIGSQSQNLGLLGGAEAYLKPIRTLLGRKSLGGEYVLEVSAKAIEPLKQCEVAVMSRIVETDGGGRQIAERIIFEGRGDRECGN